MEVVFTRRHAALGSLAVTALLALVAFGLPWVDRKVPGRGRLQPGVHYLVGGAVEVLPPAGTFLDLGISRSTKDAGWASFVLNGRDLRFVVTVDRYPGPLDAAARRVTARIDRAPGLRHQDDQGTVTTAEGVVGRQGGIVVAATEKQAAHSGRYAVFVVRGPYTVEVIVLGRADLIRSHSDTIQATFASVRVRRGP